MPKKAVSKKAKVTKVQEKALKKKVKPIKKPVKVKSKPLKSMPSKKKEVLEILEEIENHVAKNDNFLIIYSTSSDDFNSFYYVISKLTNLEVCKVNNNSIFQPHEKREKKDFCVLSIIQIGKATEKEDALISELKKIGCAVSKVNSLESVKRVLSELD